ncbi:hypothetical protein PALU110988_23975 [Paenibacillus lupini]|nr:hypothetical protein [Paenibacillus lupini]
MKVADYFAIRPTVRLDSLLVRDNVNRMRFGSLILKLASYGEVLVWFTSLINEVASLMVMGGQLGEVRCTKCNGNPEIKKAAKYMAASLLFYKNIDER